MAMKVSTPPPSTKGSTERAWDTDSASPPVRVDMGGIRPVSATMPRATNGATRDAPNAITADCVVWMPMVCQVEAPPFKEKGRGEVYRRAFEQLGLRNVRMDGVGNVIGERPGTASGPHLVFSAHLDTVFPEGTKVEVTRTGTRLRGPGITDDCRGLAVLLGVVRALRDAPVAVP